MNYDGGAKMDDFERYGDYNEIDEPPKKSPVLLFIKITCIVLVFSVIGFLAFRVFSFNYYPKEIKNIYFNDTLRAFYNERGGEIGAKTQGLRAPYDDEDKGNFFCDNLIIIPELGQLQVSVRYNAALIEALKQELKIDGISAEDKDSFSFRLYMSGESENEADHLIGTLDYVGFDSFLMYRYYKLVFDGVDFKMDSPDKINWIRLEIFVKGAEQSGPYSMIAVYENNENYDKFKDYKLSGGERP
jgi:hypothetical protein